MPNKKMDNAHGEAKKTGSLLLLDNSGDRQTPTLGVCTLQGLDRQGGKIVQLKH